MSRFRALWLSTLAFALILPAPLAAAQAPLAALQEIVVSGARISGGNTVESGELVPVVKLRRNADFLFVEAVIESDSLEATLRATEVNATLRTLKRQADADPAIALSLKKTFETEDDELIYLVDFSQDAVQLTQGYRPSTTRVTLIVKTPISPTETDVDAATARLEDFIDSVQGEGRASVISDDEYGLTVVDIEKYRGELLQRLAADAAAAATAFGGAAIAVTGLQEPVRWKPAGPLQIDIYFPYTLGLSRN